MEKRINQKCDEISILRETIKTLYSDNERISSEKESLSKELVSAKESGNAAKKKLKRQEEEMSHHKSELKKLTSIAEERLNEYLKEDEGKQRIQFAM